MRLSHRRFTTPARATGCTTRTATSVRASAPERITDADVVRFAARRRAPSPIR
jgi:hypothetical protein